MSFSSVLENGREYVVVTNKTLQILAEKACLSHQKKLF